MNILVTGGSGFLGQALCRALLAQGHTVRSYPRGFSPALAQLGVRQTLGALHDKTALRVAMQQQHGVLHNAAKASGWGTWQDFYQTNVLGTQCIIEVCRELGIGKLLYTSTPSVVHAGRKPVAGGNERDTPYGSRFTAHYPHSKMLAERAVLAANDVSLATLALRPRLDVREPARNGDLDRLVVAKLEVQERVLLDSAPVAAVEAVAADHVERARHPAPLAPGHDQQAALGHGGADDGAKA